MTPAPILDENTVLTPNGREARFLFRRDSNDHNVIHAASHFDEYGLKGLSLEGWALDLGSHIGGIGIPLAVDHPNLHVICVEPVPENADLIRRHAEMNGVADRVSVIEAAIGEPGTTTTIRYGFRADSSEYDHHAWVGNASMVYADPPVEAHDEKQVECLNLLDLAFGAGPFQAARVANHVPAIVKVDAEGGEWGCLEQLVKLGSPRLVGEWHPVCGRSSSDELVDAFRAAGYDVALTGPVAGPGGFTATR